MGKVTVEGELGIGGISFQSKVVLGGEKTRSKLAPPFWKTEGLVMTEAESLLQYLKTLTAKAFSVSDGPDLF